MKVGDYTINSIYQGGVSSFSPNYSNVTAGSLGLTTDARTANIMKEVSTKLATGVKQIEVEMISPEMIDQIPKQQLEGVKQLSKLAGANISVHGPVIDTTGIVQQQFSELNREDSERKILHALKQSREINPDGNIPVTFHSSEGLPGTEWKIIPDEKKGIKGVSRRLIVVDRESGRPAPLEEERMYYPRMKEVRPELKSKVEEIENKISKGLLSPEDAQKLLPKDLYRKIPLEEGELKTPEWRMDNLNLTKWDNSISQILFNKERADEILQQNAPIIDKVIDEKGKPRYSLDTIKKSSTTWQGYVHYKNAEAYLEDVRQQVNNLFHQAYKYGDENQKKILKEISERYSDEMRSNGRMEHQSGALQELLMVLKNPQVGLAPDIYVPVEKFAVEQSSKTFGNAAFQAYKKFGDNSPILNIENPPTAHALGTGEDLRKLVEESRKQFVENAKKNGMSEKDAKKQAEKFIGATWDVGHINMLRRSGFDEKEILKETEKIAPFVKHVHLSDNFGMEHTELPMGMGNVPMKDIMEKLGKQGFEAPKVIEAVHWWQHFQSPPVQPVMELMGSPIYTDGVGPYWSQNIGLQQGYLEGYGMMLPQTNYSIFGAGFGQLPKELGGQVPGAGGSRMSGRGME